jgi:hypothetical protein
MDMHQTFLNGHQVVSIFSRKPLEKTGCPLSYKTILLMIWEQYGMIEDEAKKRTALTGLTTKQEQEQPLRA